MDRGSKRRQVKPLAASLLDALDYDSSDDSDFEVGDADASGSEGSAIGSDEEEGSKEESAAEDSDNDSDSDNIGSATDGINEEQTKELTGDDTPTEEKEKTKEQQPSSDTGTTTTKDPAPSGVPRGQRRREEKASDTEAGSGGSGSGTGSGNAEDGGSTTAATQEPKKWNLRRNRPMLDFTTMEELNEMDDYDSEDDNDWRPAAGKKKAKTAAAQKGGSEGEEDEEDDDRGSGSDEDDNGGDDDEAENEEGCSSDSDKEVKKPKRKVKSSSVFDEELTNDSMSQGKSNEEALLERAQTWSAAAQRMEHILICCVCLGDNSEDADEIIQCDNCGVTVHEGCYGVDGESDSIMSSASENSTEPWFCDACKNGVMPSCELCPNQDGIFKETDAGRWVHVVCALYVPGVAFGDIDKLRPVTLTEMNYSKYGAKECSFCEDARFARTGVCISCDAGMCRSYFHVTCAQRDGLLSEAAAEEDIADPFFAYCKQHADRYDRKWKRKNYLALQSYCKASLQDKEKQLAPEAQARITTRLQQYRARAELSRNTRPQAWVPREKLPRPLTSSASAIRKLMRKAELMGISTDIFPVDTSDISASVDGRRKHKQPALTADFVNYYLERNMRMIQIQDNISEQKNLKDNLESEQEKLHVDYNKLCESLEDLQNVNGVLRSEGQVIWTMLGGILGQKLNSPSVLKAPKERKPSKKEGGAPGKSSNLPAVLYSCGICKKNQDQHLLLLCDTCKLYYHLGCLEPPLTRMPKKTKNSYWQCSECDQASSDDADIAMETLPDGTKRSRRQIKGPIKFIPQEMSPEAKKRDVRGTVIVLLKGGFVSQCLLESRLNQRTRGQKRKRVSICEEEKFEVQEPSLRERRQRQSAMQKKTPKADDTRTNCTSCKGPGDNENLVRCDECCLCYHFGCLDPPLKKSPKQTGYGWICQECDTSSSKEEEEEREEEHEEDEEDDSVKEETTEHEIPTEIPN
ncbi:PHD finger protein 14-like isoform X2 [Coregonus clupeaformis]|uniref:PHD finger protein 14-like isoform X2 n=1 Tax=Coregonus clupeaformis TaxID=59861 RepID=UPI001E1C6FA8|nr:PHD finger protein 14-like isoform X2 [Coregonus clupeaformis]